MVRLATQTYKPPTNENKDDFFIHLTNTTLNKKNKTENSGLTRKLDWYKGHLKEQGHNFEAVLEQVKDVLIKTMLAGHPYMNYSYEKHRPKSESVNGSHCFHLFGVDVILDQQFKPWLIELNGNPSLFGQLPDMKMQIFKDVLNVLNLRPEDRTGPCEEKPPDHKINLGGFDQIYPCLEKDEYYKELYQYCVDASKDYLQEEDDYIEKFTTERITVNSINQRALHSKSSRNDSYKGKVLYFKEELMSMGLNSVSYTTHELDKMVEESRRDLNIATVRGYWNGLSPEERNQMHKEREEFIFVSMQRSWKVFTKDDMKEVKLFTTLQKLFQFLSSNDCNGLLKCCLSSDRVDTNPFLTIVNQELSEDEVGCIRRILEIYQAVILVNYHLSIHQKDDQTAVHYAPY